MVAWTLLALVVLDVLINLAFPYPSDPKNTDPPQLALYFDYGRSAEAKLRRITRADPSETAPITLAGWYRPLRVVEARSDPGTPSITVYGMSHAVRLAEALDRTSTRYQARTVGAPGATTNWAYGAYLRDRGGGKSKAVVLALMSANLPMINTMSPMTWNVSFPMPYTADRFYVQNNDLRVVHPPYQSFEDYVRTLQDPQKWEAARLAFKSADTMYDDFLMTATYADQSALLRLVRRAYGQRVERQARADVLDKAGFNPDSEQIKVANAIVKDFAAEARKDGVIPVVFLVNNFGYSDVLFRALQSTLEMENIPVLSSHTIVSPNDPRGYLPDSHFTDENDDRLAQALEKIINAAADDG